MCASETRRTTGCLTVEIPHNGYNMTALQNIWAFAMNISQAKVVTLLTVYDQKPSREIQEQLVRLHVGLVRKVAYQACHECMGAVDAESVGTSGLLQAIKDFGRKRPCTFSTFAVPYIRDALHAHRCDRLGLNAPPVIGETH